MGEKWSAFRQEAKAHGAWRVIAACAVGYGLGVTVLPFYSLGAFVAPLEAEFGWGRSEVQGSLAMITTATLLAAWAAGWLIDRIGVRRVALGSQIGVAAALALLPLNAGNLILWYANWLLLALIGLGTSPISWSRAIAGWFEESRGLALALALSGGGLAAITVPSATTALIEVIGWRGAYLVLALAVLLIGAPVTFAMLPERSTRPPADGAEPTDLAGVSLARAMSGHRFWLILLSSMAVGFAVTGVIPNLMPMLVERGVAAPAAAGFVGLLGFTVIVGRLAAGVALDRFWGPAVACVFLSLSAVACLILASGTQDLRLITLSAVLLGFATGAEFDLVPYLCARYFGMRNYARIYALQWVGFTTAAGVAPAVFGYSREMSGSYATILQIAAGLLIVAPVLLLGLGRYPPAGATKPRVLETMPAAEGVR